jgi:hypothetical protein
VSPQRKRFNHGKRSAAEPQSTEDCHKEYRRYRRKRRKEGTVSLINSI